jgi:hypothetical protein
VCCVEEKKDRRRCCVNSYSLHPAVTSQARVDQGLASRKEMMGRREKEGWMRKIVRFEAVEMRAGAATAGGYRERAVGIDRRTETDNDTYVRTREVDN